MASAQLTGSPRGRTLNKVALVIFLLGWLAAGIVYGVGQARWTRQTREKRASADGDYQDGTLGFADSKRSNRDVEMYSGKLGVFVANWSERWQALKPFESTAILVGVFATVGALGCWAVANFAPSS